MRNSLTALVHTDTMNLVGDKAIIFGGSDGVECFSDVFILDLSASRSPHRHNGWLTFLADRQLSLV